MRDLLNTTTQKPRKSVIYAWNYVEWGGAQIYFLALIREAKKHFDVLVVLPEGSDTQMLRFLDDAEVNYEYFGPPTDLDPASNLTRKIERHWRKVRSETALSRYLLAKDLRNSVVHIDLLPQQSFVPFRRLLSRTHIFFTMHNSLPRMALWRERIWKSKLGLLLGTGRFHIFASNQNAKDYFRRFVSDDVFEDITITRAGIDPAGINQIFETAPDREQILDRFEIPKQKTLVLTVGQFIDRKGRWTLLEAIRLISRERDGLLFLWLSPNPPSKAEAEKIAAFGIGNSFRLVLSSEVGTRTDYLRFLRIADIYVLPSFVEGIPISLLEAMALGIPSISTEINGIPEAIENRKTGLLVKPGDTESLKYALLHLANDPGFRKDIAARGRSFVMSNFDENESAKITSAEYMKYLSGSPRDQI